MKWGKQRGFGCCRRERKTCANVKCLICHQPWSSNKECVKIGTSDSLLNIYCFTSSHRTYLWGTPHSSNISGLENEALTPTVWWVISCQLLSFFSAAAEHSRAVLRSYKHWLLYILVLIHSDVLEISFTKTLAPHTLCRLSPGRPCLLLCYTSYKWNFNPMPPEGYLRKDSKANNYEASSLREPISVHGCLATALTGRQGESCLSRHTLLAQSSATKCMFYSIACMHTDIARF